MGSGLLYLSIVVLWAAVLVPMWLKRLTQNELGSIDKFNRSMSRLGTVPKLEVPTYRAMTPRQIAATRRRRTVLVLSAITVFGSVISIVTGLWLLMVLPATLLFGFFAIAWQAIIKQEVQPQVVTKQRLQVSRAELAAKAKEWNATPPVLPTRVTSETTSGLTSQQMLDLAAMQSAAAEPVESQVYEVIETTEMTEAPEKRSAAG